MDLRFNTVVLITFIILNANCFEEDGESNEVFGKSGKLQQYSEEEVQSNVKLGKSAGSNQLSLTNGIMYLDGSQFSTTGNWPSYVHYWPSGGYSYFKQPGLVQNSKQPGHVQNVGQQVQLQQVGVPCVSKTIRVPQTAYVTKTQWQTKTIRPVLPRETEYVTTTQYATQYVSVTSTASRTVSVTGTRFITKTTSLYLTATKTVPTYITTNLSHLTSKITYVTRTQNVSQYITITRTLPQYITTTQNIPVYITRTHTQASCITSTVTQVVDGGAIGLQTQTVPNYAQGPYAQVTQSPYPTAPQSPYATMPQSPYGSMPQVAGGGVGGIDDRNKYNIVGDGNQGVAGYKPEGHLPGHGFGFGADMHYQQNPYRPPRPSANVNDRGMAGYKPEHLPGYGFGVGAPRSGSTNVNDFDITNPGLGYGQSNNTGRRPIQEVGFIG